MNVIGKNVTRSDFLDKVLGKAIYADDLKLENMLYAKALRSPLPHARILETDIAEAMRLPGVVAVITAKDIPGKNRFGSIVKDQPVLADDKVRFAGEPIALVAAQSERIAEQALGLIRIKYEDLQPVFDPSEARLETAPKVHDKGNVASHRKIRFGDVTEGFAKSDVIIEGSYTTPFHSHAYLEPEAAVAALDNKGNLTIWTCCQHAYYAREEVGRVLNLSLNKINVIQTVTGGGFGGKLDLSVQFYVALLSLRTGRPVKMVYSREESIVTSPKRHPFNVKYKTGATREGRILAVEVEIIGDAGAYLSFGPGVLSRAAIHATGPYNVPNVKVDAYTVYTNNPFAGAMRGFGLTQIAMAYEAQIDRLASKLGIDPIELRLRNAYQVGSVTPTGQTLLHSVGLVKTLEEVRKVEKQWRSEMSQNPNPARKRGIGAGVMWYGIGSTSRASASCAIVSLLLDGSAVVSTCCADIGQGSDTVFAQIAAEELGISPERVRVISTDSLAAPEARSTSASGQTYITGNAVKRAAVEARSIVLKQVSGVLGFPVEDLELADGTVRSRTDPGKSMTIIDAMLFCRGSGVIPVGIGQFRQPEATLLDPETGKGIPYSTYAFGTHLAEIEVDTETGSVTVLRYLSVNDCGKAINPLAVQAQSQGGLSMGLGQALMEQLIVQRGIVRTRNLGQYLIPTSLDIPDDVGVGIVEDNEPTGPFGAKGLGEMTSIPTIPAVFNAIYDAVGVRIDQIPANSERVYYALTGATKQNRL